MSPDQAERWMKRFAEDAAHGGGAADAERAWAMAMLEAELEARRRATSPLDLMRLAAQATAGGALAMAVQSLPQIEEWLRDLL